MWSIVDFMAGQPEILIGSMICESFVSDHIHIAEWLEYFYDIVEKQFLENCLI